jgi:hypothetical protein
VLAHRAARDQEAGQQAEGVDPDEPIGDAPDAGVPCDNEEGGDSSKALEVRPGVGEGSARHSGRPSEKASVSVTTPGCVDGVTWCWRRQSRTPPGTSPKPHSGSVRSRVDSVLRHANCNIDDGLSSAGFETLETLTSGALGKL